jgi:hypothetical protein
MRLNTLVTATLASLVSLAAHAGPGFFKASSPQAPAIVREASSGIYRYVLLAANSPYIIAAKEYDAAIAKLSTGHFVDRLISQNVEACKAALASTCQIPYAGAGTAFITGPNHDLLVTVAHNLQTDAQRYHDYLDSPDGKAFHIWLGQDEETLMRNMPLNFVLFDAGGKPVFDTRSANDYANPEVMGTADMVNRIVGFHGQTPVDFVSIRLSRPVGNKSLALREDRASVGEKLTVVGFPEPTKTRQFGENVPDSDGIAQVYSTGAVLSVPSVLQFMYGPTFVKDAARDEKIASSITYTDSEAVQGFSGSPVLDEQGRVAGILDGNWSATPAQFYMPNNAIILHSEWLQKNFRKYAP